MIRHKAVGIDFNLISLFIFEEEIVVELFCPIGFQKPGVVVAFPGDMKGRTIINNCIAGLIGHGRNRKQSSCQWR